MNTRISSLVEQIRQLEREVVIETKKKETDFLYQIRARKVHFTDEAKQRHKEFRISFHRYLLSSSFPVLITIPFIWVNLIPLILLDVIGTMYQAICFPIYGIPKVARHDYLVFDRHRLSYLNFVEKLNCEYCAYGNGILAYFSEIAGRTEQYWCPIKHAGCAKCNGSRTNRFFDFGDAENYRAHVEEVRRDYTDIDAPDAVSEKQPTIEPS